MDPWATPSPWADDGSGGDASSSAATSSSSTTAPVSSSPPASPIRPQISPVRLALPSLGSEDPWASPSTSAAPASAPDAGADEGHSTPTRVASPAAPAALSPLNERAGWQDERPDAWAPSVPSTSAEAEADEPRPPSPWGGVEALPPPSAFATQRRESGASLGTVGAAGAGGGGWTPERRESVGSGWAQVDDDGGPPRWPGSAQSEQFAGTAESDRSASPTSPSSPEVELQVRDLDAERAAATAASSSTEASAPAATSRFAAPFAALASWRKPATLSGTADGAKATSSIRAASPPLGAASTSTATSPPRKGANDASTASEGPGWKQVPRKPESGLAARFSGLWGSTSGSAPRIASAAEEEEESPDASSASRTQQDAQMAAYGSGLDGTRDAVPISGGSEAVAPGAKTDQAQQQGGLAKWLRWGRKAGAPPPSGMSDADLEWLEGLPAAPEQQGEGQAEDLDSWLKDVMAARPGAAGGSAAAQRPMVQSTSRATGAPIPRIAQPPRSSALLDLADFDPISGSAVKRSQSVRASGGPGGGAARMASSFSNDASRSSARQQQLDDDFDDFATAPAASMAGLPRWASAQPAASTSTSGTSPARATVGSGLGRGRYSARNLASLQPRRRGSYEEEEDDEDDYGHMSPREGQTGGGSYTDGHEATGTAFRAYRDEAPVYNDDVDDDSTTRRPAPPPKLAPPPATRTSIDSVRLSATGRSATPPIRTISPVMSSSSSSSGAGAGARIAPTLPPPPGSGRLPPPGSMRSQQQQPQQQQQKGVDLLDDFADFTSAPSPSAPPAFTPPASAPLSAGTAPGGGSMQAKPAPLQTQQTQHAGAKTGGLSAADLSFFDGL